MSESTVLDILGPTILSGKKGSVETKAAIAKKKTIGIYFSASWCVPCQSFTPLLSAVYESKKEKDPNSFEVIYCSWDKNVKDFEGYYAKMPWKAIPFERANAVSKALQLKFKTKVKSIPTLLFVDPKLDILVDRDGRSRIMEEQQQLAMDGDRRQLSAHTSVKTLSKGVLATVFILNDIGTVEQRKANIRMDLDSSSHSQGRLIWDALNEAKDQFQKSASGEMSVAEIDGISLGKTGIILKAAAGGGVKNNQCFSLTAGTKVLAAAVDNPADCGAIFQAIQHLLACGKDKLSQDKKMATDGSVKDPVVGFRVLRWSPEMEALEKKRKELEKGPPSVDSKAILKCAEVKALSKGLNIMAFVLDDMQLPKAVKMCLVYKAKEGGRLGTLVWCDRRKKRKPPKDCGRLDVESLASVSMGKQSRILLTAAATMAEAEACLCLIGPDSQIAIEMEEGEVDVEVLIKALEHIIRLSQDKIIERRVQGHGKAEKVTYGVIKVADRLKKQIDQDADDYLLDDNGPQVNVATNWSTPLGFEGGVYAGGGG